MCFQDFTTLRYTSQPTMSGDQKCDDISQNLAEYLHLVFPHHEPNQAGATRPMPLAHLDITIWWSSKSAVVPLLWQVHEPGNCFPPPSANISYNNSDFYFTKKDIWPWKGVIYKWALLSLSTVLCWLLSLPSNACTQWIMPTVWTLSSLPIIVLPLRTLSPHQVTPDCHSAHQTDSHNPFPTSSHSQLSSRPPNRLPGPFPYITTTSNCHPTHQPTSTADSMLPVNSCVLSTGFCAHYHILSPSPALYAALMILTCSLTLLPNEHQGPWCSAWVWQEVSWSPPVSLSWSIWRWKGLT